MSQDSPLAPPELSQGGPASNPPGQPRFGPGRPQSRPAESPTQLPGPGPTAPKPRGLKRLFGGTDAGADSSRRPRLTKSSSKASSDPKAIARVLYVVIRGTTELLDRVVRRRRPELEIKASSREAREMARPLARYAARRISFDGDGSDTADGLSFLFAAAAYISRVIGVDLDEPEGDADFDHELMEAIESEVAEAIKARRPAKKASKPRKAKAKAPAADQAPDQ